MMFINRGNICNSIQQALQLIGDKLLDSKDLKLILTIQSLRIHVSDFCQYFFITIYVKYLVSHTNTRVRRFTVIIYALMYK